MILLLVSIELGIEEKVKPCHANTTMMSSDERILDPWVIVGIHWHLPIRRHHHLVPALIY